MALPKPWGASVVAGRQPKRNNFDGSLLKLSASDYFAVVP
jgi:hypothetical protein